jgi:hypothetical protein
VVGGGVWRGGAGPEDVQVGTVLDNHLGAADHVNGEEVGYPGLEFG